MPFPNLQESPDNNAIRELRDELKDLNKTIKRANLINGRFTTILFAIAFIQLVISIFQFAFTVSQPGYLWIGLSLEILTAAIIFLVMRWQEKWEKEENVKK